MEKQDVDLGALDTRKSAEEGYELQLMHPGTGDLLDVYITVLGEDSEPYQEKLREMQRKSLNRVLRGRNANHLQAEAEAEAVDLLVVATKSWRRGDKPALLLDGQEYPFNQKNARLVYGSGRFNWIREQVSAAIKERAHFLRVSAGG
jgi:hypothetical protein